jgi:16S rRNA (adenine1518-N6/adenine1519-N6)-dimethyltransferase
MHHRPRKRFGQNFLHDRHIIQSIIQAINPKPQDPMVEIGPGLGALTRPLLAKLNQLIAIEIDTDLQQHLQHEFTDSKRLHIIGADALQVDFSQWGPELRVVGNLPYNISTPLLFHLLTYKHAIRDMHFMLQKEVVQRLCAEPGSKAYGRLSIMVQLHCDVECLFLVPATAFNPAPKVESAIVRLTPHSPAKYPDVDEPTLQQLVTTAFAMRRKTLANNLKSLLSADAILALDIDPSLRPEQLSIEQYIQMAQFIFNSGKIS